MARGRIVAESVFISKFNTLQEPVMTDFREGLDEGVDPYGAGLEMAFERLDRAGLTYERDRILPTMAPVLNRARRILETTGAPRYVVIFAIDLVAYGSAIRALNGNRQLTTSGIFEIFRTIRMIFDGADVFDD